MRNIIKTGSKYGERQITDEIFCLRTTRSNSLKEHKRSLAKRNRRGIRGEIMIERLINGHDVHADASEDKFFDDKIDWSCIATSQADSRPEAKK
jgi:hypothetical protein